MNNLQMRSNLIGLINKYVNDERQKNELLALVDQEDVPVKGVIADLTKFLSGFIDSTDEVILKDLVFYYC